MNSNVSLTKPYVKNVDFFVSLICVPADCRVRLLGGSSSDILYIPHVYYRVNYLHNGLFCLDFYFKSIHVFSVSVCVSPRFIEVYRISFPDTILSDIMLFRPDELEFLVPGLMGKFRNINTFLPRLTKSVNFIFKEYDFSFLVDSVCN